MRLRVGAALVAIAGVGVAGAAGYVALREVMPTLAPDRCTATVEGHTVRLTPEQAENAALIAGVAVGRGLPARAVTIALATAYQESKLYNIDYGDRDSLGLFQQRPSQGWGTPAQVQDPLYAATAFYDALVQVDGYRTLRVTEAAQRVQRSAYPEAYADHEADARVLASALTGWSEAAFSCRLRETPATEPDRYLPSGLTPRAEAVRSEVAALFDDPPVGGFSPDGVDSGHIEGSAHYSGRAVDIFVRPVSRANKVRGWSIAHYFVAQADRLDVATVIFDGRIWSAPRSDEGWRRYQAPDRAGDREILMHRDHVHVDVAD